MIGALLGLALTLNDPPRWEDCPWSGIFFQPTTAVVRPGTDDSVQHAATVLRRLPADGRFLLTTIRRRSDDLADRRVRVARRLLIRAGVPASRITTQIHDGRRHGPSGDEWDDYLSIGTRGPWRPRTDNTMC